MAKLTLTVDTETNVFTVQVNGETVDASSVEAYQYGVRDTKYHETHFTVSGSKHENDVCTTTRLYASESDDMRQARASKEKYTPAQLKIMQAWEKRNSR